MMLFRKCISDVRILAVAVAGLLPLWPSGTARAQVAVGISVNFAPPALPVYTQPLCPGEGYLWTPGYWAWDPDFGDYYWVPGTWVLAPLPGYLWTPPYWGWNGVSFIFHEGYWGPRIGFYGGIDYGYGYPGRGYYGGRWERDRFYYNRSVNNVNVTQVHNVYNQTVINNVNVTRVSYNGGEGGVREQANRQEQEAFRERHVAAVPAQQQHIQEARADRGLRASDNRGKPPIAATDRPGQFRGNVVAAREGHYNPPANRPGTNRPENPRPENNANRTPEANRPPTTARPENRPQPRNDRPPNARGAENNNPPTYVHPNDLPKANRPDRPATSGNAKAEQKYDKRSDNLYKKQEQERQDLQRKQEQQHARAEQQQANDARRQQMEHQHQQQTEKLEQHHQQQQEKMQREAPKGRPEPQPQQPPPKQQQRQPGEKPHGR